MASWQNKKNDNKKWSNGKGFKVNGVQFWKITALIVCETCNELLRPFNGPLPFIEFFDLIPEFWNLTTWLEVGLDRLIWYKQCSALGAKFRFQYDLRKEE